MELRYFKGNPVFAFEDKSAQVQAVWEMKLGKGETVVPHGHPDGDEIYIVVSGIGEMVVGDKRNTVIEGDVVFIPAHSVHHASNKMDLPFHCVGVLLAKTQADAARMEREMDTLGRLDARTAISHMLQILAFAADARRKLEGQKKVPKEEIEQQVRGMEEAVMKAVEKVLSQYKGL